MNKQVNLVFIAVLMMQISACSRDADIATVNGRDISTSEFSNYLKFKRIPEKDEKRREAALQQYLEREAMADVIKDSKHLDAGLIEAELNEFRKEMLISRYFERFLQDKGSDQAVQNYYTAHANEYEQKKVHVAHILFRTHRNMKDAERKAKQTAAHEAYSKIKSGKKFEKIAGQYSEDKVSGKRGGDLGWVKQGAIDPKFSEVVFSLKKGKMSEPFETAFGFHIVKLVDGPTVVKQSFDAVRGNIRYMLRNKAKNEEMKRIISETRIKRHDK